MAGNIDSGIFGNRHKSFFIPVGVGGGILFYWYLPFDWGRHAPDFWLAAFQPGRYSIFTGICLANFSLFQACPKHFSAKAEKGSIRSCFY